MATMINSSPAAAIGNQSRWKRKASDDESERQGDVKRSRFSWHLRLQSESPIPTDEDDESIYSVQHYETEFARDTSDTSTHSPDSSNESDYEIDFEYELNTESDDGIPLSEISSSSEPENIVAVEFIEWNDGTTLCDTEELADNSDDSRSSIDSEIKRADFWTCVQCKNPNNNPMFRYCEKCYRVRKSHFPRSRPRRKARAQKNSQSKMTTSLSITSTGSSQELCEMDSGIASSQDLDKPSASTPRECNSDLFSSDSQNDNQQTKDEGSKSQSSDVETVSPMTILTEKLKSRKEASNSDAEGANGYCLICTVAPKDSAFVHGKTTHICCCYHCSVKVCKTNGYRCPICNCKVSEVCKVFYV